jgi:hypothetical protein
MFSTPSYGEWTMLGRNVSRSTFYIDFERIRKHDGYVYWWDLTDRLKPSKRMNIGNILLLTQEQKTF